MLLQARRGIDDVAGDHRFSFCRSRGDHDDRLSRVDRGSHRQLQVGLRLVQLVDGADDAERCSNGAFGIVLVRNGRAEHRHHRVADELLDRATEAFDLLFYARVICA